MGAAGLLGLPVVSFDELALHTMVRVWHTAGEAGGLAVGTTGRRLDMSGLREPELQTAELVRLV